MKPHTPLALVILDGFGIAEPNPGNAVTSAKTPTLDQLMKNYPHTQLKASGSAVGLPDGVVGNSEVGHMTIGTGQIIKQALTIINDAIADGSFFTNERLMRPLKQLALSGKTSHIIGLLSDAGVHGTMNHLIAYAQAAESAGVKKIVIHPILDGRDVPPKSAAHYLTDLEKELQNIPHAHIGTLSGRFYAMDRNRNWDRTCKTYEALKTPNLYPNFTLFHLGPEHSMRGVSSWQKTLDAWYATGESEEFLPPITLSHFVIESGDGVILANFRPERMRQLYDLLTGQAPTNCAQPTVNLSFCLTAVKYTDSDTSALFEIEKPSVLHLSGRSARQVTQDRTTLKQELSKAGYSIFSIAETEKYAHVTYFFDAGNDKPYPHEQQILIPSIKARTYIDYPCMSAPEITQAVIHSLENNPADFYLINYANGDMVGHSGSLPAAIKAVECLDKQIGDLYREFVQKRNGVLIITADHGNVEKMIDEHGNPDTAHTTNDVPFIIVSKNSKQYSLDGLHGLSDIAPFILHMLDLTTPKIMQRT